MVVIAGSFDQDQGGMGAFQEWNQVGAGRLENIHVYIYISIYTIIIIYYYYYYHHHYYFVKMESCRSYVKYAVRLETMTAIPFHVEKVCYYNSFV